MHKTMPHLNDEHMQLYEWSGTGSGISIPAKSKRTHPWRASYAVLGVLTSLLVLNGCDNQDSAEQASEQIEQKMNDQPLYDDDAASQPMPEAEAGGPAADEAPEPPGEKIEPPGEDPQKP
ncbi:hypothetical protein [Thiobacillus denitrificans]|uniref:Uncharacterized protein n=1 Tax=Thiobacillus denitrificans TaxID=36861 RepID=A0A125BCH2_THIDE|nr:hypothetical protein [Thiobacillus denitrificans]KVW95477.1 hypothetical protein ABW22_09895 [Thiobacillus denitrificans]